MKKQISVQIPDYIIEAMEKEKRETRKTFSQIVRRELGKHYNERITREQAVEMAQSRDCSCVNGKDRDNNYERVIHMIFDQFEI
jgi:hypothetical protein